MTTEEKYEVLKTLAGAAIERLKELPQPVVRVCGPLTSKTSPGFSYEQNLKRFLCAQAALQDKGLTIFDYFEGNHDESQIQPLGLPWEEVMLYYHRPIMESGWLKVAYFMPYWQESSGARFEREECSRLGITIEELPETWLAIKEGPSET